MGIIADNMTANGMPATIGQVAQFNWILGAAILIGLLLAIFVTYRRPREYKNVAVDTAVTEVISDHLTKEHIVTILAIIVVVVVQILTESLALSALGGLLVMFAFGAIKRSGIDEQFAGGVKIMGMIAFILLMIAAIIVSQFI